MEFKAVHNLQSRGGLSSVVLEAKASQNISANIAGQSMGVWILTDKMIEDNHLAEVSDPIDFKNGIEPTDKGLFSTEIFGETIKDRKRRHAYIDLKRKFFHPFVYENLLKLARKDIEMISSGQGAWWVNDEGALERIDDKDDRRYDENNTGLAWLVDNYHKIKFKETGAMERSQRIHLLDNLTDEETFITKWIVIPIFYRDATIKDGKVTSKSEINELYGRILRGTNSYANESVSVLKHLTLQNIQKTLVDIRKIGQSLIEKKSGAFQKSILGKSVDYGGRGVISVPSLNGCDKPDDCLVDVLHSGIPLSYCITSGYPFMIKWVTEFFEDYFRNKKNIPVYNRKTGEVTYKPIADQSDVFTKNFIDKKMETYKQTYGAERFETVKVLMADGSMEELYFGGTWYGARPDDPRANTLVRPMTWTDVFYLAAVNTLEDKHCYITRYPLEDYFGTFPSRVSVLSTIRTIPVIIEGKVYPHYPYIDLSLKPDQVARQFIDTFSISNLYLDAIGGDYDGDTVSEKILFSMEANEEAEKQLHDIKHYVSIQGRLVRVIGNESYLSFYNMTRRE